MVKTNETLKARFDDLPKRKVVKLHRLFKCIFYFLEFSSESICIEGTQVFFWKKARHHWNDALVQKMLDFKYIGKKDHAITKYQTINYIERNLEGLTQESINQYSFSLGLIYKWMTMMVEARKKDIIGRLHESKQRREEREQKIEEDKQRTEDRKAATEEAKEKWENENAAALAKFQAYEEAIENGS